MNLLTRMNIVTSRLLDVTEHMARVMTPPSKLIRNWMRPPLSLGQCKISAMLWRIKIHKEIHNKEIQQCRQHSSNLFQCYLIIQWQVSYIENLKTIACCVASSDPHPTCGDLCPTSIHVVHILLCGYHKSYIHTPLGYQYNIPTIGHCTF